MKKNSVRRLTESAMIAALYAALTWISGLLGLAIGPVEFRISEALCILPVFLPSAVPGLFIGCIAGNLLCGGAIWDIIFGSLATLIGAMGTRLLRRNRILSLFPPVLINTLMIPWILYFVYGFGTDAPIYLLFITFFIGEAISVFLFGLLLGKALDTRFFKWK